MQLGHDYIGTEHMLLGLTREGDDGVGSQVLVSLGVDLLQVRAQVLQRMSLERVFLSGPGPEPHATPRCPGCSKDLHGSLRFHRVVAEGDAGEPPRLAVILWCGACGTTIGVWPEGDTATSD
jgi:hypothetical protein